MVKFEEEKGEQKYVFSSKKTYLTSTFSTYKFTPEFDQLYHETMS